MKSSGETSPTPKRTGRATSSLRKSLGKTSPTQKRTTSSLRKSLGAAVRQRKMVTPHPSYPGNQEENPNPSGSSSSMTSPLRRTRFHVVGLVVIAAIRLSKKMSPYIRMLRDLLQDRIFPPATLSRKYDGTSLPRSMGGAFQDYKVSSVSHSKNYYGTSRPRVMRIKFWNYNSRQGTHNYIFPPATLSRISRKYDGASLPRVMRIKFWNYNSRQGTHPGGSNGSKIFRIIFVIIAALRLRKLVKSCRSRRIHKVDQPLSPIMTSDDDVDFSFWLSRKASSPDSSCLTVSQPSSPVWFPTLPEDINLCLLYLFLFPPGYEFERDTMVQLWMAREFIYAEATQRIEDRGNEIFELLVSRDLIVPLRFDKRHDLFRFKMNESKITEVYPNGLSSPDDFLLVDEDKFYDISNHGTFGPYHKGIKLHTLVLLGDFKHSVKHVPRDLFLNFGHLITLDLSGTQIYELPSSIGNLEDLKYLDLSYTHIREFPGLFCALENLQTLKLRDCSMLIALPRDMMKLIMLRHLDLDIVRQLNSMPKCIGKLVNIQTLKGFIVGVDVECGISQLSELNGITGSFCISRLENIRTVEEAMKADLRNKKHITKLEFRWEECINSEMETHILESLVPHPNLVELQIQFFSGSVLPPWIGDPSFTKVTSITLFKCINCSFLPCFGNLPSLKFLSIIGMENLREINSLFCRDSRKRRSAFPMLEKLSLENMMCLEQWTGVEDLDFPCLLHISIKYCPKLSVFPLMAHQSTLNYLELNKCDELQCLPEAVPSSLDTLIIEDCPMLQRRCLKDEGEDWAKIAHIPNIWIDDHQISQD